MTKDQVLGVADRLLIALTSWLAAKGYITQGQVADIISLGVAAVAVGYGFYINRPVSIAKSAAALPGTLVVTTPEIAAATPNQENIRSSTETEVKVKP